MNMRLSSLLLAMSLAASSLAMAEGATAPAAAPGAQQGSPAPMGPMMGPGANGQMMGPGQMKGPGHMKGQRKGGMNREALESFTEETVRKLDDGRVIKRSIEQKVSEGKLYRKEVFTNPAGKSATRTLVSTLSKDGKTWTQKVEGVDFDGQSWSRSRDIPVRHGPDADDEAPAPAPAAKKAARPGKGG